MTGAYPCTTSKSVTGISQDSKLPSKASSSEYPSIFNALVTDVCHGFFFVERGKRENASSRHIRWVVLYVVGSIWLKTEVNIAKLGPFGEIPFSTFGADWEKLTVD
jgi:hypothetical protein